MAGQQQYLIESDNNYTGFASRLDPSNLPPGIAQASQNMRLWRGTAQPRKGAKRLTDSTLNGLTMVGSGMWVDADGNDNVVMLFSDRMYLYRPQQGSFSSLLTGPYLYPDSGIRKITLSQNPCIVQALDKMYIFRGRETEKRYGTGGTSTTAALDIAHPAVAAGATVTVTATWINVTPASYAVNDEVTIFNITDIQHPSFNNSYIVTSVNGSSFTFTFTNNTGANINAAQHVYACCVRVHPPFVWDGSAFAVPTQSSIPFNVQTQSGYTTADGSVPAADFGFYFQNRIVCNITNHQLAVSDILSPVFDFTLNNFTINQGGNDNIVGVLPWIENQFLVFMQRSVYLAYVETTAYTVGASPGANSSITVLSTEVNCLARRTITSAGQFVFFLSSKGVHMMTPQLDLKLLGNTMPLSEPVDDFFQTVNFSAISGAVATFFDNRFFIAVPTGTSTRNNAILIYNTLNQAWETIDVYPTGMYIDDLQLCAYKNKKRLMLLTNFIGSASQYGGVFLTEEYPNDEYPNLYGDQFNTNVGTPILPFFLPATLQESTPSTYEIIAKIRTRELTFGNIMEKRFSRVEAQFNNSSGDVVTITTNSHDSDAREQIMGYTFSAQPDTTLRGRMASRGASVDIEFQFVKGRASLKGMTAYAIAANRPMISQE